MKRDWADALTDISKATTRNRIFMLAGLLGRSVHGELRMSAHTRSLRIGGCSGSGSGSGSDSGRTSITTATTT